MNEITTTISELLATSRQIAESAQRVAQIAEQTASAARAGRRHGRHDARIRSPASAARSIRSSPTCWSSARSRSRSARCSTSSPSSPSRRTSSPSTRRSRRRAPARAASASRWSPTRSASWPTASAARPRRSATLIDDVRSAVNTTVMATETGLEGGRRRVAAVRRRGVRVQADRRPRHDHDRGGARDRAVHQAADDRGRAGQRRDRQRRAGVEGDRGERRPDAADGVAAGGALEGPAADHPAARRPSAWRRTRTSTSASRRASSLDQLAAGRPRAGEGRQRRGAACSGCCASRTRSRARRGSSSSRRSPTGRTRSRTRSRRSANRAGRVAREQIDDAPAASRRASAADLALARPTETRGGARASAQPRRRRRRPRRSAPTSPRWTRCSMASSETHALLNGLRGAAENGRADAAPGRRLLGAACAPRGAPSRAGSGDLGRSSSSRSPTELRRGVAGLERNLGSAIDQMDRELRQVRDAAEQLRLVPAGDAVHRARADGARRRAGTVASRCVFEGTGGDMRLDAHVLGTVQGALVADRAQRGRARHRVRRPSAAPPASRPPDASTVDVVAPRQADRLRLPRRRPRRRPRRGAARRRAARGLLGASGTASSARRSSFACCCAAASARRAPVTEVSGRGIGLDVVREAVERPRRRGRSSAPKPGQGTTFELVVPLVAGLAGRAGRRGVGNAGDDSARRRARSPYASPPRDISRRSRGDVDSSTRRGDPVRSAGASARRRAVRRPSRNWTAVVVAGAGGLAAVGVDRLLGTARIVVRPLPEHAAAERDRRRRLARRRGQPAAGPRPRWPGRRSARTDGRASAEPTRRCEASGAGRRRFADDAHAGAEHPRIRGLRGRRRRCRPRRRSRAPARKRYALFLVDVEMPGMDGFTFVETHSRRPGAARHSGDPGHLARRRPKTASAAATSAPRATSSRASSIRPSS